AMCEVADAAVRRSHPVEPVEELADQGIGNPAGEPDDLAAARFQRAGEAQAIFRRDISGVEPAQFGRWGLRHPTFDPQARTPAPAIVEQPFRPGEAAKAS